jgi:hypothetical protein
LIQKYILKSAGKKILPDVNYVSRKHLSMPFLLTTADTLDRRPVVTTTAEFYHNMMNDMLYPNNWDNGRKEKSLSLLVDVK